MDAVPFVCVGVLLCYLGTVWLLEWPMKMYWSKKEGPTLAAQVKQRGASVVREELKVSEAPEVGVKILKTIAGTGLWLVSLIGLMSLPPMLCIGVSVLLVGVDANVRRRSWKQEWMRSFV